MNRFASLAATLALAAAPALPALAAPQTYVIDPTHTYPSFSYKHLGLSTQRVRFNGTTGKIVLDKEARTASVDIVIDMKSVDTGYATFDEHIQAADFLDTANHPRATFKSRQVRFEGDRPVAIDGELTIKGITRPVTLEVTHYVNTTHPMQNKDAIGADAQVVIRRSEFDAGAYVPAVSDEVTILIALEAIAE